MVCALNRGGLRSVHSVRSGALMSDQRDSIPELCDLGKITYSRFASIFSSPKWGIIIKHT